MFPFLKRRPSRKEIRDKSAVNWILIGFVLAAIITHVGKEKTIAPPDAATKLKEEVANAAPKAPIDLSTYKSLLAPNGTVSLQVQDIEEGEGRPAVCGQTVKIAYEAFGEDDQPLDDGATKEKPLSFRIGDRKVMPAFEQGLVGMRKSGVRNIFAPANMAYGITEFAHKGIPGNKTARFKVTLLDATPEIPDPEKNVFRIINVQKGIGNSILCGQPATVHITVWSVAGKKLYSTHDEGQEPITFTPGKSEIMLGIEQGLIGMSTASARTLIIPPAFQKTMEGNAPARALPLPDNEIVLVDAEAVP